MAATIYISNWRDWQKLCKDLDLNPHKTIEFSEGLGGGNTRNFEYTGDIPEKEDPK